MATYTMDRSGGCTGAETGQMWSYESGDEIQAPEGEFSHLPDSAIRSVDYDDRMMTAEDEDRYQVREGEQGWWKVIDTETGEPVDGQSERSEEEAQANADELNGS